ncbi:MAG: radical SAM protein [Elusimicrobia bacterium]|nr:radical SAM protein [Elusimicrobiota bacterium]
MKTRTLASLVIRGVREIFWPSGRPLVGTIILTDFCNLSCAHCATSNHRQEHHSYDEVSREIRALYDLGVRILFFSGGETMLWRHSGRTVRDLVREAKAMGFPIVNFVTNGTVDFDTPEASLILLSLDGTKPTHDDIRGVSYDRIMENLKRVTASNVCAYVALNSRNYLEIPRIAELVKAHPKLKSMSFNFHTPYPGTEGLAMSRGQKEHAAREIKTLIGKGYPIFNLSSCIDSYLDGTWSRPCAQCVVSEDNARTTCGRCSKIAGLCKECGYLFAVEYSKLFAGDLRVIFEMLRTYPRYV